MVAKCANPSCGTFFRYLRSGKLFLLERPPIVPTSGPPTPEAQFRNRGSHDEYFWLCEKCAKIMTITSEESGAAMIVPLKQGPWPAICAIKTNSASSR
jgi:hypothetical protein